MTAAVIGELLVIGSPLAQDRPDRVSNLRTALGFGLLAIACVAAAIAAFASSQAEGWFAHSMQVRSVEQRLFSAVQDAETSQRGYLLTGDESYLEPLAQARGDLASLEKQLSQLTRDNPEQQARLGRLKSLIDDKMVGLERTVSLRQAGQADMALVIVRSNNGHRLMRQIRAEAAAFEAAELALLDQRQRQADGLRLLTALVTLLSVLAAASVAFLVARDFRRYDEALRGHFEALNQEMARRVKVEDQLRQAQKMEALGQLTGGVAHDFNNMLAIIVGNLDLLLRRVVGEDPRARTLVESALNGAQRAAALTKKLLAFSRLQPLDPKPTDVNRCVRDMSEMLRRTLGEAVVVETVLGGGLWTALVDAPQLESALLNLAVNARDAMPRGGKLTLETCNAYLDQAYADAHTEVEPGQYVQVAVTDTGVGMAPEVIARAFDPFFTTKGVGEGTGLGLSQVHGFLKQSRGHVKIYSELGVGTTIKLYLPRNVATTAPGPVAPAPSDPPILGRFTILVVEDDPGVRNFAVSALQELGFLVREADSAGVALEILAEHPEVTLLLTDVVMPVVDGRRLVDAALKRRPGLKILYMTGYTRNAIVHNGVLDPGTRLLTKPFTIAQLDRELRAILAEELGRAPEADEA